MKFSIQDFLSKCDQIRICLQLPADLVTFTEEILNGKLDFLCSVFEGWDYLAKEILLF